MSDELRHPPEDDLLEKLDRLLHKHRPAAEPIPTLEPAPRDDNIPVLTDAVAAPRASVDPASDPYETVESRLIATVSREVSRLQGELPEQAEKLRVLGNTLVAAIRLLARRHLSAEAPEDEK